MHNNANTHTRAEKKLHELRRNEEMQEKEQKAKRNNIFFIYNFFCFKLIEKMFMPYVYIYGIYVY